MKKKWQQNQNASEWAQWKRLMELYSADPAIRQEFAADARRVIQEWGFTLDADLAREAIAMKYTWNPEPERIWGNHYYSEFIRRNRQISEVVQQKAAQERFADGQMYSWNQLVTNRLRMENRDLRAHSNIRYYPVNFELSDGCKVQCPFCGLAAPVWKADFPYTEENRTLWREVLEMVREVIGPIASSGICYYATEPMDNPDYEKFLLDFAEILGDYPQTTTAVADKYPERIRALIAQIGSERMEQAAVRFSVRTLRQFYRIMEEYSAEELSQIELLMNNPESDCCYSASGRILEHPGKFPKEKLNMRYSISCIAGFKINMVQKTVTFMEPEMPGEEFPKGIREYEVRTFRDAGELRQLILELSEKWIHSSLPQEISLRWNPHITVKQEPRAAVFEGDHIRCKLSGNQYFYDSIRLIEEGLSFQEICRKLTIGDLIAAELMKKLNLLYQKGYLRIRDDG